MYKSKIFRWAPFYWYFRSLKKRFIAVRIIDECEQHDNKSTIDDASHKVWETEDNKHTSRSMRADAALSKTDFEPSMDQSFSRKQHTESLRT